MFFSCSNIILDRYMYTDSHRALSWHVHQTNIHTKCNSNKSKYTCFYHSIVCFDVVLIYNCVVYFLPQTTNCVAFAFVTCTVITIRMDDCTHFRCFINPIRCFCHFSFRFFKRKIPPSCCLSSGSLCFLHCF